MDTTDAREPLHEPQRGGDELPRESDADIAHIDSEQPAVAGEKRFIAVGLPGKTLDALWEHRLDELLGSGRESKAVFHNRRNPGGDMHYCTITYDDPAIAQKVAARPQAALFCDRVPTVALARDDADPTEVEVLNLALTREEILKQFSRIGPIVSHRMTQRKQKASFVFASREDALRALKYDQKTFQNETVSVKLVGQAAAAGTEPAAPAEAVRVKKRKRAPSDAGSAVGKLSATIPRKRLLKAMTPVETQEKIVTLRKKKEPVMEKLKLVNRELAKVARQKELGEEVDAKNEAVLHSERDRLLDKRKRITKAILKIGKPVREQLKQEGAADNDSDDR
eukprot:TRINITY_DN9873_c0_g2_i1.p1 TRINITY_DN9873_c0_g2~~TRINITY_DN9873_c0_g2_i1.p1  ORF type:complete len:338 (+),score=105.89 TRINITY_DN9873_c0_g2_i1:100-1113(+)